MGGKLVEAEVVKHRLPFKARLDLDTVLKLT